VKIIIKGTNTKLSPSINQYIEEKIGVLEKFLKDVDPEIVEARVEVGKTKHDQRRGEIYRAEVNLKIGGKILRVEKTESSLYAAIDLAKDELSRQVRRDKDKRSAMFIRGARSWKKFWKINPLARFRRPKIED